MASGIYSYAAEEMHGGITTIRTQRDAMDDLINSIRRGVEQTLQEWESGASQLYISVQDGWNGNAAQMRDNATHAADTLTGVLGRMDTGEDDNKRHWA